MIKENKELFELMFELEEIEEVGELGYENTYDISVTGSSTFLLANGIVSHNSAKGGLMPILGRDGIAYYELKGKIMNAYSGTQKKFTENKELTELYQIIKQEDFDYILSGTDQDLDGIHISSLLVGFFQTYLEELLLQGKLGRLVTPVFFTRGKDKKPKEWVYNVRDIPSEKGEYVKGLGSFEPQDLTYIMEKDGLDNMIEIFDMADGKNSIEEWLGDDSEPRKKYIMSNDFDLIKI